LYVKLAQEYKILFTCK